MPKLLPLPDVEALQLLVQTPPFGWSVLIWPEEYCDPADRGYGWSGDAANEKEAVAFACAECDADNGWDEGNTDPATVRVIDAGPDFKRLAVETLKAIHEHVPMTVEFAPAYLRPREALRVAYRI